MEASERDLELRLLGPLEVVRGNQIVDLGKGRDREVLARLAISANQVVPADRLVDDLWGEAPPPSAAHALQVHVSNLRKRLEPDRPKGTDGGLIHTHKPGYLLRLAPEQLDVTRFERAAERGRTALRDGRADEAAELLRGALAIWRGPALAEVAYEPWAEAEAGRLEAQRLAALEDRFDADLGMGRHGAAVGEIEAVARQHPWRERVWGQFMLALYRSGRQAEALRAGHELRRALRDELGLDPSAEIRTLEQAILDQDPALDRPSRAPAHQLDAEPVDEPAEPPTEPVRRDEQKVVTTLFADLTGSTPLGELLEPEEYKAVVDEVVSRMLGAVARYDGTVVNVAGDGILALFGAPAAHEDDAERAVRAGLDLVGEVAGYGAEVADAWDIDPPAAHVGIHTGLVVLGPMGDGEVELTAMGDVVNTAARIEGQATAGTVLVSEATRRTVEPLFEFDEGRSVTLKGKRDAVEVSEVTGIRPHRGKVRGLAGADVALVGRQRELAAGRRAVDAVIAGSGGIVLVTGEAGLGKSRYVSELAKVFDDTPTDRPKRWLTGRSLSYGERLGYWPFRELLRDWLGVTGQEPELRIKVRLRGRLESLFGGDDDHRQIFLGNLLGLRLDAGAADYVRSLSANERREATFAAVVSLLARLADEGPVVVAFDDLHWADGDSLGLVEELLTLAESAAVLVIVAQRLEREHPSWEVRDAALRRHAHRAVEIALGPLGAGHDAELLDALLGAAPVAPADRRSLLDAAEGNPFFLEELVRSLLADGADGSAPIEVPETVDKVIQSRIDGLSPAGRDALGAGSVLGRQFDLELLGAVVERPGELDGALADLQRLDMVREVQRWPRPEYRFRHSLIQDTAYRNLVPSHRQVLHGRAARALEGRAGDEPDGNGVLAHHFELAGDDDRALRYYRLAAEDARAIYAQQAALAHYDAALRLVEASQSEGELLAELTLRRGQLRRQLGHPGARADLFRALGAARDCESSSIELAAISELGMMELYGGTPDSVQAYYEDGLTAAEAAGDPAGQATLLGRLAIESVRRLRLDQAVSQADRALELARRSGDDRATARALDGLKRVALSLGELDRFEVVVDELDALLRADDDQWFLQHLLIEQAVGASAVGRVAQAFALCDEAVERNTITGNRVDEPLILSVRAQLDRAHGRYDDAIAHADRAVGTSSSFAHAVWLAWAVVTRSAVHLELEEPAEAIACLDPVLVAESESAADDQRLRCHALAALAHAQLGHRVEAERELAVADQLRRRTTCPPGTLYLGIFDAEVAASRARAILGDGAGAVASLELVLAAAERAGWLEAIAASAVALAELTTDDEVAARHADRAVDAAVRGRLPGLEWRARAVAVGPHRRAGRRTQALEEESLADRIIDDLGDRIGEPDVRAGFRNRARRRRAELTGGGA